MERASAMTRFFMGIVAWPEWHGMLLGITCMLQMGVSLWIDRHYDRDILRYLVWTIWYPLAFWMINMFTTVVALPATILRRKGKRARWTSPDRGVIANERSTASVRAIEHE